jgi:hypothetical protein
LEVLFFKSAAKVRLFFEPASIWMKNFKIKPFFYLPTTSHTL